ncbi:MAG: hypothetical protein QME07_02515 [bacterium]|nr:hypothetical protein [bacterium]
MRVASGSFLVDVSNLFLISQDRTTVGIARKEGGVSGSGCVAIITLKAMDAGSRKIGLTNIAAQDSGLSIMDMNSPDITINVVPQTAALSVFGSNYIENSSLILNLNLPQNADVSVNVYNIVGQKV